jgi:hypothetical protein
MVFFCEILEPGSVSRRSGETTLIFREKWEFLQRIVEGKMGVIQDVDEGET